MIDRILSVFRAPAAPAPLPEAEAQVALAALMVAAARSDGDYAESEKHLIDRLMMVRHGLGPFEAAALRAKAEAAEAASADLVRFTRALKDAVPYEDRVELIEALWEVVLADGRRDSAEDALMRKLAGLLYVPDQDVGLARQRVMARLEKG